MPGNARQADFLHLHANVSRRVRNLETGVHPTATDSPYADEVGPIEITLVSPFRAYAAVSSSPVFPYWQRRYGVVTLTGAFEPSTAWSGISGDAKFGTLPAGARPLTDLVFNVPAEGAPYYTRIRAQADGDLYVIKTSDTLSGVYLNGATWTID